MISPVRFGRIHIISPEKAKALSTAAEKTAPPTVDTTLHYIQSLVTTLKDESIEHPGEYMVQDMKDGRRVILSNSDTRDLEKYRRYQQKRLTDTRKPGERVLWDKAQWVDEFITVRSGKGERLNFVEAEAAEVE